MTKRRWMWPIAGVVVIALGSLEWLSSGAVGAVIPGCVDCHTEITQLSNLSKHATLGCATCHTDNGSHAVDQTIKPATSLELATCGGCHKNQYDSFYKVNIEAQARNEKGVPTGRSPMQDKRSHCSDGTEKQNGSTRSESTSRWE